jgi:hypothetical protein
MDKAPAIKRLVDLVDRGPEDEDFFPFHSNQTVFRRVWPTYNNVVSEVVEIGHKGVAKWGERITIPLNRSLAGDLVQWIALRFRPLSWLGPQIEGLLASGDWDYEDPSAAWMWASSLGTAAIRKVFAENPSEFDPRKYLGPARDSLKGLYAHKNQNVLGSAGHA